MSNHEVPSSRWLKYERRDQRGQMLVIVGVAMVALVAMVGLIIDGGFAWSENRAAQNGVDAAAHAGAIVILEDHIGDPRTDGDVWNAMEDVATVNGVVLESAEYTTWEGASLGVAVTDGGSGPIPDGAQGVRAVGAREHETFFMQVVGIDDVTVRNDATSVTGPADPANLLPVSVPVNVTSCDGQNKAEISDELWVEGVEYVFPLCGNPTTESGGSYGWIDWYDSGGAPEIWEQVCDPNPPTIHMPGWYEVIQSGNVNPAKLEDCFNDNWAGKLIQIPLFDDKCITEPAAGEPCTQPGSPKWYHFPAYAVIQLEWAYINGSNDVCNVSNNGATSCLVGTFVDAVFDGSVGGEWSDSPTSPSQGYAVQLID